MAERLTERTEHGGHAGDDERQVVDAQRVGPRPVGYEADQDAAEHVAEAGHRDEIGGALRGRAHHRGQLDDHDVRHKHTCKRRAHRHYRTLRTVRR